MPRVLHISETGKGGVGAYLDLVQLTTGATFSHQAVLPASEAVSVREMPRVTFADQGRGAGRLVSLWRTVRAALRDETPDIIFLHATFALMLLPLLRITRPRVPVIYCAHGWSRARYGPGWKRRAVEWVEGTVPALAARVVNVSVADQDLAEMHRYRGRHVAIENACPDRPVTAETGLPSAPVNLLFVGRMARQKGLDLLLPAFADVMEERGDLRLFIAGGSASEIGPQPEAVEPLGWVDHATLQRMIAAVDAVIMPSRWEGLPMVVPEALCQGTPLILSTRSGMAGLIEEGVSGLSFELETGALRDCLAGLSKARLTAMRPAARSLYEARFHPDRFGAEMGALLADVLTRSAK